MELNKKLLKLGLVAIGIILVTSLGFAFFMKLDNPVFLKSFIEVRVSVNPEYYQPGEFQIRYISNAYDNRQVGYIEFISKDEVTHKLMGNKSYERVEDYGLYNINTLQIEIYSDSIPKDLDRLEFNNGKVHFNNGDTMDVDLGRIILHTRDREGDYFQFGSGGSSSDGTSSSIDTVKDDISLIELESPMFKEAQGLYDIKIDGIDYREIEGMNYEEGDILRINSMFRTPEGILERYTQFELQPRLYFKDLQDNTSYINIYNIRHMPYEFDFWGIVKYLKARGEI